MKKSIKDIINEEVRKILKESSWTEEEHADVMKAYSEFRNHLREIDKILAEEESWVEKEQAAPYFREPGKIQKLIQMLSGDYEKLTKAIMNTGKNPERARGQQNIKFYRSKKW